MRSARLSLIALIAVIPVVAFAGCNSEPDLVVDDVGATRLVVDNRLAGVIDVSVVLDESYALEPTARVTIEPGTADVVAEGWDIGGGLLPSQVARQITIADDAGAVLVELSPVVDDAWERDPASTWQLSTYTFTVE